MMIDMSTFTPYSRRNAHFELPLSVVMATLPNRLTEAVRLLRYLHMWTGKSEE